ncbi:MAG: MlaD family protein [Solirubrobacteraceae bacterium]
MPDQNGDAEAAFGDGDQAHEAQSAFARAGELVAAGDTQAAEEQYRRADELGHPSAPAYVGMLLETRGDTAGAEEAYRRADERGDGFGAFRLGMLLSNRGDWADASEAWGRAEERGSEPPGPTPAEFLRPRPRTDGDSQAAAPGAAAPGGSSSPFANPVLIGAITVLAVVVAVFLAYNANSGLPFVPTRELKVDIADASNLVIGNDVREGGFRVGLVSNLKPIQLGGGRVGAELELKLDQSHSKVPVDSTATIMSRSLLGLKFVELHVGQARKVFADGATLPLSQTTVPVQVDDVFKTFDARTRNAIQRDLYGFGNTLAGRGSALNDTIASLPELLQHLQPVAAYLSDPNTQLTRFFTTLNAFVGTVAPLSQTTVRLFGEMATTFSAITRDPNSYEATIAEAPSTLDTSTDSLKAQQPFLVDLTTLGGALSSPTGDLQPTLVNLNPAIEAGTHTLARTPALNSKLQDTMNALKDLARNPGTNMALNALRDTVGTLNPMIRYLGPYITVCNSWNYWWTFLAEHISEETTFGFAQRALFNQPNPLQPNNVGTQGATAPVNGGVVDSPLGGNAYLHGPTYGAAVDNQGNADCEIGQRGYPRKLNFYDPQGRLLESDPHTPGDQGPTFRGSPHVPAGETFSRNPQFGPQLPPVPGNN